MGCWILDSTKACLCASALCVIPGGGGAFADSEDCVKPIEQAESTSQCMIECGTPELNGVTVDVWARGGGFARFQQQKIKFQ